MGNRTEGVGENNSRNTCGDNFNGGATLCETACDSTARKAAREIATGRDREVAQFPEGVRASVMHKRGEYDARRLRSQREVIRDVMLSAAECDTWLTLGELRALTRYGEASISAQLRHLRKAENGGYELVKRHREAMAGGRAAADARGERTWEYRLSRGVDGEAARGMVARLDAAA